MTFIINILCKVLCTKEIRRLFKKVFKVAPIIHQAKGGSFSEVLRCFDQSFSGYIICTQLDHFLQLLQASRFGIKNWLFSYSPEEKILEQLKKVVELCAKNVTRKTLIKAAQNFRKRATFCLANEGGHFKHLWNSRPITLVNKTLHNMLMINVIKRTYI